MDNFFNFPTTSNHLHPLQVENCDSNSRIVVDEDDNGKFRLEKVNSSVCVWGGGGEYFTLFAVSDKWVTIVRLS